MYLYGTDHVGYGFAETAMIRTRLAMGSVCCKTFALSGLEFWEYADYPGVQNLTAPTVPNKVF